MNSPLPGINISTFYEWSLLLTSVFMYKTYVKFKSTYEIRKTNYYFCLQLVRSNRKALWQLWRSSRSGKISRISREKNLFTRSLLNFGGKLLRSLAKVSIFGHTCKYSYVSYRFLWHGYLTNCWWSYFMAEYQFLDDYILGYEIVNEPWCGDVYEVPFKCIRRK